MQVGLLAVACFIFFNTIISGIEMKKKMKQAPVFKDHFIMNLVENKAGRGTPNLSKAI